MQWLMNAIHPLSHRLEPWLHALDLVGLLAQRLDPHAADHGSDLTLSHQLLLLGL